MLIGRKDGPRFEASREGVRLIGFSRWPEPLPRTASDGRPLKRSYAERIEAVALPQGRHQRVTTARWDEILGLRLGYSAGPAAEDYSLLPSTETTRWFSFFAAVADLARSDGHGSAGRRAPEAWSEPPRYGLALIELTTDVGTWFLDAPLDRRGFGAATVAPTQALLDSYRADAALRAGLPATWPTGAFRPGLE
ncbi:hypothetical protein [Galactobacter valiniphilus]|uniref:hypothetical protein n=1 Tax=Galactobacter valiniphilus TaxID=2676122 RepID=UPI0037357EAE